MARVGPLKNRTSQDVLDPLGRMLRSSTMFCPCFDRMIGLSATGATSGLSEKRARNAPSLTLLTLRSGFAAGEAHRRGAGSVVGFDVDEADHALLDLLPGASQGGAD